MSVKTHILYHSQERALRPVPQKINFLVEQAGKPVHKSLIEKGAISNFQSTILLLLLGCWKITRFHRHSNRLSAAAQFKLQIAAPCTFLDNLLYAASIADFCTVDFLDHIGHANSSLCRRRIFGNSQN